MNPDEIRRNDAERDRIVNLQNSNDPPRRGTMELSQSQHDFIVKNLNIAKKCIEELTAERDAALLQISENAEHRASLTERLTLANAQIERLLKIAHEKDALERQSRDLAAYVETLIAQAREMQAQVAAANRLNQELQNRLDAMRSKFAESSTDRERLLEEALQRAVDHDMQGRECHHSGDFMECVQGMKDLLSGKSLKRKGPIMHVPGCDGHDLCSCKPVFGEGK